MMLPEASAEAKLLVLGTALWGWGVDRETAWRILDLFVEKGGEVVDTAINYPINKQASDYGIACQWLSEWVAINPGKIAVLVKIGAVNNLGEDKIDLAPRAIGDTFTILEQQFGPSLGCVSIHWDSRGGQDGDEIRIADTVRAMEGIYRTGVSIGFSGVRRPDLYLNSAPYLAEKWWVQVKENALTSSARKHYSGFFPSAKYLAYGINMGGIKRESADQRSSVTLRGVKRPSELIASMSKVIESDFGVRPTPSSFNHLALLRSYLNPFLSGVIIGPRNLSQLQDTMAYWGALHAGCNLDWSEVSRLGFGSVD